MFFGFTKPAYITIASDSITEVISTVFFYLYNKTIINMEKYHDKLVISQNITYSFELIETINDVQKKDDIKCEIIKELVKDANVHLDKK